LGEYNFREISIRRRGRRRREERIKKGRRIEGW
jgi:hypothetical protein